MASSAFDSLRPGEPIEVVEMTDRFAQDPHPDKINLSVGGYRNEDGEIHCFKAVREVELDMAQDPKWSHGYMTGTGDESINRLAFELLLGSNHTTIREDRCMAMQSIGGTAPLRVGAEFLHRELGFTRALYSNPTWMNHRDIFVKAGFAHVEAYPYWNKQTECIDFQGWIQTLKEQPENTVVILHTSAHNPTGVDPTQDQWKELCAVIQAQKLFPFFDCAYQGFATGDLDDDAWSVRYFADQGLEMLISQSFGKNMSLYGERIGFLVGIVQKPQSIPIVKDKWLSISRSMYSYPAKHGAWIVGKVLQNPQKLHSWTSELKTMVDRVRGMRARMRDILEKLAPEHNWAGLTAQVGMFYYSKLTPEQGVALMAKHHVYILPSMGRINLGGVTERNVALVAQAIAAVVN
eukprot:snap_masked-scaffold349_size200065-processed-gene-1.12 protein:Tk10551 transcript:snap_masked-scaffold349_size200065-processed-gene-1.12-mRNA-1 annotation:"aspartate cytoplasmic"